MYLTILYRFDKEAPVAVGFTVLFLAMYALLSFAIQRWRSVEEHYKVTKNYLEVVRKKKIRLKRKSLPERCCTSQAGQGVLRRVCSD